MMRSKVTGRRRSSASSISASPLDSVPRSSGRRRTSVSTPTASGQTGSVSQASSMRASSSAERGGRSAARVCRADASRAVRFLAGSRAREFAIGRYAMCCFRQVRSSVGGSASVPRAWNDAPRAGSGPDTAAFEGVNAQHISTTNHIATHLDSPLHFFDPGPDIAGIPIEQLVGPACVVDLQQFGIGDYDIYGPDHFQAWEKKYNIKIERGDIL